MSFNVLHLKMSHGFIQFNLSLSLFLSLSLSLAHTHTHYHVIAVAMWLSPKASPDDYYYRHQNCIPAPAIIEVA